jgi:GNAT superfamily N-acetyltransferase
MSDRAIRLLTDDDLDAAFTLSTAAGWNQRLDDWRMLLRLAPRGAFAALNDGRLIGTAIGIDYGGFAWIAMMLVDPEFRGRGVGGRLLEAAMHAVPAERIVRLDATPLGRPLYQRYGFEDETTLTRHVISAARPRAGSPRVRQMTAADIQVVTEQDREVFGGDRRKVLEWALDGAPQYAQVIRDDSGVAHYCFGRQGRLFDQIGPVVAGDNDIAQALVSAAVTTASGRPVAVDAFDSHGAFTAALSALGFQAQRPLFRMCRRAGRAAPRVQQRTAPCEFAILGPEFA